MNADYIHTQKPIQIPHKFSIKKIERLRNKVKQDPLY